MRARSLRPVSIAALLLAVAPSAFAQKAPVTIEVHGDDFPVLVHDARPSLRADDLPPVPGCDAVRARRVDELPYPWSEATDRVHLDCEIVSMFEENTPLVLVTSVAFLKPGRVWLAGHAISEVRLMDSELWGDHQYVIAAPYDTVKDDLRHFVEERCAQRHLRDERESPAQCTMEDTSGRLYMESNEIGGTWIHADPDDPGRTIYAEAWAD